MDNPAHLPWDGLVALASKTLTTSLNLGSNISCHGTLDMEVANRLHKASRAFGSLYHRVWKDNNIQLGTKLASYQPVVLSVLLYGCQTWVPYQQHVAKLKSFHQRWTIIGIRWQEHTPKQNQSILLCTAFMPDVLGPSRARGKNPH